MRCFSVMLIFLGLTVSNSAYAGFFFFFIPGSSVRAVADSITGAKGNICVKEGTQVGQILSSGNGNTAKVLSLSGTSSICPNPTQPIRAELEFTYNFSSKAGIDLPDDFQTSKLTDLERFNGWLLKATSKGERNHGIQISTTPKKANFDIETIANNLERSTLNNQKLKDVASARSEKLTINGMSAVRFEISGTLTGIFGQRITYQYTIIDGDNELVVVDVYAPVGYMESNRPELQKMAEQVSGLRSAEQIASPPLVHAYPPTLKSASDRTVSAPVPSGPLAATQMAPVNQSTSAASPSTLTTLTTGQVTASAAEKSALAEQRLQRLSKLLKDGVITQPEFDTKKQEIMKDL